MSQARNNLPEYLKEYLTTQNYESYTARDQATWRCIMRQGRDIFGASAHPDYLRGLQETGIPISRIPHVDEMDQLLDRFGWGAVCVEGFIPPAVFLAFQGHKLLPIACDMRTLEHIAYTPAPDIVHEAAGHAPILVDQEYASYLAAYSTYANKAIYTREDVALYEAIRCLSDMKENPEYTEDDIHDAESKLQNAEAAVREVSEAGQLSRMNWWTAEYGLVGNIDKPHIFGAGLLSSLMEGEDCLKESVRKIPLSLQCIEQGYDITNPQPQLYVAKDFQHLKSVLESFGETMAFRKGGHESLKKAYKARTITTSVFDHGLAVSGVLSELDIFDEVMCLEHTQGCQISKNGQQIPGWGHEDLVEPLVHVIGAAQGVENLRAEQTVELRWHADVSVTGEVHSVRDFDGQTVVFWKTAILKTPKREQTFQGPMILGRNVTSVHGGCGDWSQYHKLQIGRASTSPGSSEELSEEQKSVCEAYQVLRDLRENQNLSGRLQCVKDVLQKHEQEWLLALEVYELKCQNNPSIGEWHDWEPLVENRLQDPRHDSAITRLIEHGRRIAAIAD